MKFMARVQTLVFVLFFLVIACPEVDAFVISNLSTGIDSNGNLIDFGNTDDDWQLTAAPNGVGLNDATVVPPSRSYFIDYEPEARWISPTEQTNIDAPGGLYTYETYFYLDTSSSSEYSIIGEYSADNRLTEIKLNGNLAFSNPYTGWEEFLSVTDFLIDEPAFFISGLNTLSVTIENEGYTSGNPTSFAVQAYVNQTPIIPGPVVLPPGDNVEAQIPVDLPSSDTGTVVIKFEQINTGGTLNIVVANKPIRGGSATGFKFLDTYYYVTFSGTFSGYFYITLPYDDSSLPPKKEARLKVFYRQSTGGKWNDCTYDLDTINNTITGRVDTL